MLDKITFAKRYAKAIFDLLKSSHKLDAGNQELASVKQVIQQTPGFINALNSVSFPEAKKAELVKPLIDNVSSKYVKNLLKVVYACGRMGDLVELINQFDRLYDDDRKIVHADLITAVSLDPKQEAALKAAFAKRVGAKKVIFRSIVDKGIIGGVIIKSANVRFDGSVKRRIDDVRQLLLS